MRKTTELAVNSPISEGLAKVDKLLSSLQEIQTSAFKTGNTTMDDFTRSVESETNPIELIKMLATLKNREDYYNKAADTLGKEIPSVPVFKQNGFTVSEWEADIKLRLNIISTKEKYDELTKYKAELMSLMDKEDKLALVMNKLNNL